MNKFLSFLLLFLLPEILPGQTILTLEKSLEYARVHSPAMRQSEIALTNAHQNLLSQKAGLKPQLNLQISPVTYSKVQRLDNRSGEVFINESLNSGGVFSLSQDILPTGGTISLRNNTYFRDNYTSSEQSIDPNTRTWENNLSINLVQPVFTYNRTKVDLERMELAYEDAYLRYNLQKLSIEQMVTQRFYNLYAVQMNLLIAKDEMKNNSASYEIIKNKVEGGLMAKEELYQQEVNLATSESNVYNQQASLENSKDEFKITIGYPVNDDFDILSILGEDTVNVDVNKAIEHALENRMELRQRDIDIRYADFQLLQSKTINEFSGEITAGIGVQNLKQNEEVNPTLSTPSIGLNLNIPIFDWGERKARIKSAEGSIQSAVIELESEKLNMIISIRRSVRNLKNLQNQIEIQNKSSRNAQLTYEINLERYKNGDLTSMDLGLFQNQLSSRKLALTNAIINYRLELLNLKIQALYDFENNTSIVPPALILDK